MHPPGAHYARPARTCALILFEYCVDPRVADMLA
jgi:hypothetical protein